MSRILPLPPDAMSQIYSSKHIVNLQGVVLSLLENSLDAGSGKVEASVDFRRGGCVLEDNGDGISPAEFLEPSGGLGRMYHTSKLLAPATHKELHGSAGTYLASLGALSLLSITSRHTDYTEYATLTIHQGRVIARLVPAPASHDLTLSTNHGTRVAVRDLFGNMPVRVKQRALSADVGGDDEKAWQELKHGVVALLLAWHRPCSVRLRDAEDDRRTLQLSARHPSVSGSLTKKALDHQVLGVPSKFDLRDALPVLFQSSLAPPELRNNWVNVSAFSSALSVKGAICLAPAPTRQCQFISIGIHPCSGQNGHDDLYDAVNKVFANSAFGSVEDDGTDIDEAEKDRRNRDQRFKKDGFTRKQLHVRKGVDRGPMFVLQVKFRDQRSVAHVSDASLKALQEILDATVRQWLDANHFRPRRKNKRKGEGRQSPVADEGESNFDSEACSRRGTPNPSTPLLKRTLTVESATASKKRKILDLSGRPHSANVSAIPNTANGYFNEWSRIKSGREGFYNEAWHGKKPATAPEGQLSSVTSPTQYGGLKLRLPSVEAGALTSKAQNAQGSSATTLQIPTSVASPSKQPGEHHASSEDFGSVDESEMLELLRSAEDDHDGTQNDTLVDWTDPVTKQAYKVNARTGVVLPSRPKSIALTANTTTSDGTKSRTSAAINTAVSSAGHPITLSKRPTTASKNQWLPDFLKEWNNPVFSRQDEERIPVASFDGPGIDAAEAAGKHCTHNARADFFAEARAAGTTKLSKSALKRARVIRQVDRKFILCKTREGESEVLVLVDQHAASERAILESLLAELCAPVEDPQSKSRVKTVLLEKPLRFQIPAQEYWLFEGNVRHFAAWGILYDLHEKEEELSASQVGPPKREYTVVVKELPSGIAERCTLMPKLLIELVRSEIWSISSSPKCAGSRPPHKVDDGDHPWLNSIGSCPKGILDMLNSRACRSAIMFNDELAVEECERLLAELSGCAFPFMCAHGRVSMVPLVEIGDGGALGGFGNDVGPHETSFSAAFGRWVSADNELGDNENIIP